MDIGGTFTDLVLAMPNGRTLSAKRLTTHGAPERAALEGIAAVLRDAGLPPDDVGLAIHGTTLATNALIERKGARTALVTTQGFRDSLEIAHEHRFEQYDLHMERPEPLVPRDLRLEVPERIAADGSVLLPLDTAALDEAAARLAAAEVEAVAVCFLHAYVNPAHERAARERLASRLPARVALTLSSEVAPEIREYERASTTAANAYVLPLMERYLRRLEEGLRAMGCGCPLLLMMSSGGVTTVETASRFPIRLVESGPAGGAIMARRVAARHGLGRAIAFDMGGTTAKLTLLDDFRPQQSRQFEVARASRFAKGSGIPVRIPVIDMVEIGAGGGSIARVDALRRIAVGPDSAGSEPGPACYGRGGTAPTVTDADVALGRLDPGGFAGGKIALDPERASAALARGVAERLGLALEDAALGIAEMVEETMAAAARVHAAEHGKETTGRALIAFGGAAPLHAARLARKLGMERVVVPVGAGVGSAHGFLDAPMAYEVARTRLTRLRDLDPEATEALFAAMRAEAEAVVRLGAPDAPLEEVRHGFMRYRGQGHEVAVEIPSARLGPDAPALLRDMFDAAYERLYGRTVPRLDVEAVTWTLALAERREAPSREAAPPSAEAPAPIGRRRLVDPTTATPLDAALHRRGDLPAGACVPGPALIAEDETSILVPVGFSATVGAGGDIVLEATGA